MTVGDHLAAIITYTHRTFPYDSWIIISYSYMKIQQQQLNCQYTFLMTWPPQLTLVYVYACVYVVVPGDGAVQTSPVNISHISVLTQTNTFTKYLNRNFCFLCLRFVNWRWMLWSYDFYVCPTISKRWQKFPVKHE